MNSKSNAPQKSAASKVAKTLNKPPLLFLHGFRGSHEGVIDLSVWLLDQGYECYYPDLPPFGHSTEKLESYDADHYAKFVADFVNETFDGKKEHRPVLIGHSMGSIIAAATAAKYPDLVSDKLILLAPISDRPPKWISVIEPLTNYLPNRLVDYVSAKYLANDKKVFKETLKSVHLCSSHYQSKRAVHAAAKFSKSHVISDFDFHKNTCLIAGDTDHLIPRQYTDILAKTLRDRFEQGNTPYEIEAHFIKGAGHFLNYENARETAKLIQDFLEK